jgi:hypothetical protein
MRLCCCGLSPYWQKCHRACAFAAASQGSRDHKQRSVRPLWDPLGLLLSTVSVGMALRRFRGFSRSHNKCRIVSKRRIALRA